MWHVYVRRGTVYAPTVARTAAGYFLDVDPVDVAPTSDPRSVEEAVRRMVARGNPSVPTPSRAAFPRPVVLKYAKVSSWSAFERGTRVWDISQRGDQFSIVPNRDGPDGGWVPDPASAEVLSAGTSVDDVARRVAVLVQS